MLVQIHGGGYEQGNSESNPGYWMVNASQGQMIYVSIQYRLDAFGFLGSAEVREDGAANAGLLDQRAALDWVQRNIRAFGGDPSKVVLQHPAFGSELTLPGHHYRRKRRWRQCRRSDDLVRRRGKPALPGSNCGVSGQLPEADIMALST